MKDKAFSCYVSWNRWAIGVAFNRSIKNICFYIGPVIIDFDYDLL